MCGLAGYIGTGDRGILERMAELLAHRGPDALGIWQGEGAGLAHRRLSILDLSETGAQPMHADRVHIVFNGEIYNAPELRRQLQSMGYTFRGHSDTEAILHGYLAWGDEIVERLSGMFAFAIWDEKRQRLLLARDRIGIKPLFYAPFAGGIVFASEIKALFAHPAIEKRLHPPMIDAYLALGYVPGPDTIFAGIKTLAPGHRLLWRENEMQVRRYWSPPLETEAEADEAEQIEALDARLNATVESHLLADVEVGAFLSGGVDSSLVAAIAARHMQAPLKTFTIGFEGGGDERPFARLAAAHIGGRPFEHTARLDLAEKLPRLLWHLEQPLFDNSILPTWLVSEAARRRVKVVLSGDGGDEPFFGYDWTRHALRLPRILPELPLPGWAWAYRGGGLGLVERAFYDLSHPADRRYLRRITASRAFRHWLYTREYRASLNEDPVSHLAAVLASGRGAERFALCDLTRYLPEDVLFKVDRMSMAHGLEVRVPLLDHRLLEWILKLPVDLRFRHGHGKYLLRKVAERYLPPEILRPRKQGFTIPIDRWLRGELGGMAQELFTSDAFAARGIVEPQRALRLLDMHKSGRFNLGHRIWSLVILEQWFRTCLDGEMENPSRKASLQED